MLLYINNSTTPIQISRFSNNISKQEPDTVSKNVRISILDNDPNITIDSLNNIFNLNMVSLCVLGKDNEEQERLDNISVSRININKIITYSGTSFDIDINLK